jgi:hypothetical protein
MRKRSIASTLREGSGTSPNTPRSVWLPVPLEAPAEKIPLPDLRTLDSNRRTDPSPEFMDLLNDVLVKQQWYHDREEENEVEPLNFVGPVQDLRRH